MYDVDRLRDASVSLNYSVALSNSFAALGDLPDDVEDAWTNISTTITSTADNIVGFKKCRRQPWLSDETFCILEQKAEARKRGDTAERKRLQGIFRAKAKEDKEKFFNRLADEAEQAMLHNDLKPAYRIVKRIAGKSNNLQNAQIQKADGTFCRTQEEVMDRWREHYDESLNHPPAVSPPHPTLEVEPSVYIEDDTVPTDAPTLDEVRSAILRLKSGRAAGCDHIPPELLKSGVEPISKALHQLFGQVWKTGKVPAEWKEAIIVSLYKGKNSRSNCSNYRPISLLSVPGKVFSHVLLARIQPLLSSKRRPQQSGFTAGRSTMDAILALRLLSEMHREFNRPLYVAFVDLKSAFDSVDRSALWKALRGAGMPKLVLDLIEDLHCGTGARVRVAKDLSARFSTSSGVRQGCVLAPALFCRAIDWIMEHVTQVAGIHVGPDAYADLDYADDVALFGTSPENLSSALEQFETASSCLGLHISWQKTKVQNLGAGAPLPDITVNGHVVESVTEFTYLGSVQSSSGRSQSDILRRIGLACSAFRSMQRVWRQHSLSLPTKLRLYSTCILPILLYGSETWTLLSTDISRLEAFHMRCQRQILGVRWDSFTRNSVISATTGLESIQSVIERRRLALFGHTARLGDNTPAHSALKTATAIHSNRLPAPDWRRLPGRPRHTWLRQIADGSPAAVRREWRKAVDRGHSGSPQRTTAVFAS